MVELTVTDPVLQAGEDAQGRIAIINARLDAIAKELNEKRKRLTKAKAQVSSLDAQYKEEIDDL